MINTTNNSQKDEDFVLNIAPNAIAGFSNGTVEGAEYWNLNSTTFGSAGFRPPGALPLAPASLSALSMRA